MNILLTGANGFLGKSILKEISSGNAISTLSRNSGNYKVSLENEIPYFKDQFDVVIHAAGKAHSMPKTADEKKQFHDINFGGTLNLLEGLEKSGLPKYFVFISSVAVYGKDTGNNINEVHPLKAKDPYGLSKIEAEKAIFNWCKKNDIICTILRLPLLVGKNPPGNLGAMINAINKGYYFNIGKGQARKSMVLSKDVARLIPTVFSIGGTFNLTDGYNPSFYELSLAISRYEKKFFNLPVFVAKILGNLGNLLGDKAPINSLKVLKITSDLTFDDSKARKLLDWNPESILDYLENESLS